MAEKWHPLHTASYLFSKAHLETLLLCCLGDRGEMAHGVEGRTPFLDHPLAEYVNGLPPGVKVRSSEGGERGGDGDGGGVGPAKKMGGGVGDEDGEVEVKDEENDGTMFTEKFILREAARPFVTDEIYKKRKHPYSAPRRYGLGGPLHRLMRRLVSEENVEGLEFLDWWGRGVEVGGLVGGVSLLGLVDGAFGGDGGEWEGKREIKGKGEGEREGEREGKVEGEIKKTGDRESEGEREKERDARFKIVIFLAQWVVLKKRFGVE